MCHYLNVSTILLFIYVTNEYVLTSPLSIIEPNVTLAVTRQVGLGVGSRTDYLHCLPTNSLIGRLTR